MMYKYDHVESTEPISLTFQTECNFIMYCKPNNLGSRRSCQIQKNKRLSMYLPNPSTAVFFFLHWLPYPTPPLQFSFSYTGCLTQPLHCSFLFLTLVALPNPSTAVFFFLHWLPYRVQYVPLLNCNCEKNRWVCTFAKDVNKKWNTNCNQLFLI